VPPRRIPDCRDLRRAATNHERALHTTALFYPCHRLVSQAPVQSLPLPRRLCKLAVPNRALQPPSNSTRRLSERRRRTRRTRADGASPAHFRCCRSHERHRGDVRATITHFEDHLLCQQTRERAELLHQCRSYCTFRRASMIAAKGLAPPPPPLLCLQFVATIPADGMPDTGWKLTHSTWPLRLSPAVPHFLSTVLCSIQVVLKWPERPDISPELQGECERGPALFSTSTLVSLRERRLTTERTRASTAGNGG